MGRFSVEFEISNHQDVVAARLGVLDADKIRRTRLSRSSTSYLIARDRSWCLAIPVGYSRNWINPC